MEQHHKNVTQLAIAHLTEHFHHPDGGDNLIFDQVLIEGKMPELLAGLTNVATWLIVNMEKETGKTHAEVLSDIALKVA